MTTRHLAALLAGLAILALAPRAGAVSLRLVTATPQVGVGQTVDVDVVISGLGDGVAPSVGSFDLDVDADAPALVFQAAAFSLRLGNPILGEAITDASAAGTTVDLFELSFLLPAELDAFQTGSFVLATVTWSAEAEGTYALSFTQASVADAFGALLTVDEALGLTLRVPEPGLLSLLLVGAAAQAGRRGRAGRAG